MTSEYPTLLTLIVLSTAVVAAGAGVVVSGGTLPGGGGGGFGDIGQIGGGSGDALCTYSNTDSQAVVVDDTIEVAGNSEARFGFTVPEDGAAVRVNARPLTVATPRLVVNRSDGGVVLRLPIGEASERDIASADAGRYRGKIVNEDQSPTEVEVEVRVGVC